MSQPSKATEARKLLAACGWQVHDFAVSDGGKQVYEVYDAESTLVRVFVPAQRLLDYAQGVFDSTFQD